MHRLADALRLLDEAIEVGEWSEVADAAAGVGAALGDGPLPPGLQELLAALVRETATAGAERGRCLELAHRLRATATAGPADPTAAARSDDALRELAQEAGELLDQAEQALLTLDDAADPDAVAAAFRAFHTIKGVAGFLELEVLAVAAHRIESLLAAIRDGTQAAGPCVDVLLAGADLVRGLVDAAVRGVAPDTDAVARHQRDLEAVTGRAPEATPPAAPPPAVAAPPPASRVAATHGTVKVDTDKLDQLVDLVGELAIAQVQLAGHPALATAADASLAQALAAVTRIGRELQRAALSMRMVAIRPTFDRMARVARDTARTVGKPVTFTTEGGATELDRTMVEAIYDPLVHLVRNAIDHGLEDPATRAARGKPATGAVTLRAYHRAGRVIVEVTDDGGGLDRARILARARDRGLVGAGEEPSDAELYPLVFSPGFSTAARVTSVSGRGVGLDVVRTNVERVRGRVDVESTAGAGTTVRLELPLTLAIIDGLLVAIGDQRFLLPVTWARELLRPRPEQLVSVQGRGRMVDVRGALYPVLRLGELLGVGGSGREPILIMVDHGARPVCLEVEQLLGKQEVVVKGLGPSVACHPGLAGGAILGDGKVALILDVPSLLAASPGPGDRRAA